MRQRVRQILLLLALGIGIGIASPQVVLAAEPYESFVTNPEWEVLKIVNKERIAKGKIPLSTEKKVQKACDIRAKELVTLFSHTRPNGTRCFTVIDECGIDWYALGENIAAGQSTPAIVMNSWMNSDGHRANILSTSFTHIGVGHQTGGGFGNYWVQLFVGCGSNQTIRLDTETVRTYAVGTSINDMKRYLVINCGSHGTCYMPIISEMCTGYNPNKQGTQTITVKVGTASVQMKVNVGAASGSSDNEEDSQEEVKAPGKVTKLTAKKVSKGKVKLSWKNMDSDGFVVYYSTKKSSGYKKYKATSSHSITVKSLKGGKKYYFKVRAYNKNGTKKLYGAYSKMVSCKA